ncbi:hypothetical protein [Dethiosulfatarculus sandiegensis]|uniref:Yip1 domain-containing protein n=1 Tax=Dethiosulfatarculus sandiegensis TaxID=1429043 RepID=A0A0D2JWJ6_9BACT|nr:hypothetical protein [Dethiosulfatarculus sandiegensis]KIX13945.1 hypothetical protein X474_12440 [Dethiosulfatarculus sandiegensis]
MDSKTISIEYNAIFSACNVFKRLLCVAFKRPVDYFILFVGLKLQQKLFFLVLFLSINFILYIIWANIYVFCLPDYLFYTDHIAGNGVSKDYLLSVGEFGRFHILLYLLVYLPGYLVAYIGLNLTNSADISFKGIMDIFIASQIYYPSYYPILAIGHYSKWLEFVFLLVITTWGLKGVFKVKGIFPVFLLLLGFLPGICLIEYWKIWKIYGLFQYLGEALASPLLQ